MSYDPKKHHRRSIRLRGYDYSQAGGYFVTICTQGGVCLFGNVVDRQMQLNAAGQMVLAEWTALAERFSTIELDAFVVMPNHVHGVILIVGPPPARAGTRPAPTFTDHAVGAGLVPAQDASGLVPGRDSTVGDIVGAFKSRTTVGYIRGIERFDWVPFRGRLWQRNYFEYIIRNDNDLDRIREYIVSNPLRWTLDRENRDATGTDDFDRWLDNVSYRRRRP
ncbi:MAG: transposase [Thermogutta sp.]